MGLARLGLADADVTGARRRAKLAVREILAERPLANYGFIRRDPRRIRGRAGRRFAMDGMGIDLTALNLLRRAHQSGPLGETVCLGRQGLHIKPEILRRRCGAALDWRNEPYAENMMRTLFGASRVDSIDNSPYEGAAILHDMNLPLPQDFRAYDTVIDAGTIEHIFDAAQGFRNIVQLCKIGGQILHVTPTNNFCGHGFWQVSPELFFSLYAPEKGFSDTEVFLASRKRPDVWFKVMKPSGGARVPIMSSDKLYCICRTVRRAAAGAVGEVQQSNYLDHWKAGETPQAADASPSREKQGFGRRLGERLAHRFRRKLSRLNPNLTRIDVVDGRAPSIAAP